MRINKNYPDIRSDFYDVHPFRVKVLPGKDPFRQRLLQAIREILQDYVVINVYNDATMVDLKLFQQKSPISGLKKIDLLIHSTRLSNRIRKSRSKVDEEGGEYILKALLPIS